MKVAVITSSNPRHYYLANRIANIADETLVISTVLGLNPALSGQYKHASTTMESYFKERHEAELRYFKDRYFKTNEGGVVAVLGKELNSSYVVEVMKAFCPDIIVVFGTNIIKGELLTITPNILNLHLGMSPYYNGSSTNFWPMYNNEYEFVGVTIHYLDAGVDTGPIISQQRALICEGDTPHTIGNKNIILGVGMMLDIIMHLKGGTLKPTSQWKSGLLRPVTKMKDYTNEIAEDFVAKITAGMIDDWLINNKCINYQFVNFNNGISNLVDSQDVAPIDVKLPFKYD